MPMQASADAIWEGVAHRYWHLPVYFVPTCRMRAGEGGGGGQGAPAAGARPEVWRGGRGAADAALGGGAQRGPQAAAGAL